MARRVAACLLLTIALIAHRPGWAGAEEKPEPAYQGKTVSEWIEMLRSPRGDEIGKAADALAVIGAPAVPRLLEALKDKDPLLRRGAAWALGDMEKKAHRAVPALCIVIEKDHDTDVRVHALFALRLIVPGAKGVVSTLLAAAKDPDEGVRAEAFHALSEIAPEDPAVVPLLAESLKDSRHPKLQDAASLALSKVGPKAIPALAEALGHADEAVRVGAVSALKEMQGNARRAVVIKPVVPALTNALKDKNMRVRGAAAYTLGLIGRDAKGAASELVRAMNETLELANRNNDVDSPIGPIAEERRAVYDIMYALRQIGPPEAKPAVPALLKALKFRDELIKESAADALKEIDPQAAAKAGVR
jgi:HEAT repeat protein